MGAPLFIQIDGEPATSLPISDRGFHYGHGLFETLRVHDADVPLWRYHRARLAHGLKRLSIALDLETFEAEWRAALDSRVGLLKLLVTAGSTDRGYGFASPAPGRRIVLGYPASGYPASNYQGVAVRICETRLAHQPLLAGLKHLNRLEQVLARAECNAADVADGLMLDQEGRLVEATASNLFLVRDGRLLTPALNRCGVAGTMRQRILDGFDALALDTEVCDLTLDALWRADEAFLCNSVFGVWPIVRVIAADGTERRLRAGTIARAIQQCLEAELGYPTSA